MTALTGLHFAVLGLYVIKADRKTSQLQKHGVLLPLDVSTPLPCLRLEFYFSFTVWSILLFKFEMDFLRLVTVLTGLLHLLFQQKGYFGVYVWHW